MKHDPLQRDIRYQPVAKGFEPPAKVACQGCPWRKDAVPGALGGWTPTMYLEAAHGPADIACHMAKHFEGHVERHCDPDSDKPRSCGGLAAFRKNIGVNVAHPMSSASIAVEAMDERGCRDVFENPNEFMLHHEVNEGRAENFWRPDKVSSKGSTVGGA